MIARILTILVAINGFCVVLSGSEESPLQATMLPGKVVGTWIAEETGDRLDMVEDGTYRLSNLDGRLLEGNVRVVGSSLFAFSQSLDETPSRLVPFTLEEGILSVDITRTGATLQLHRVVPAESVAALIPGIWFDRYAEGNWSISYWAEVSPDGAVRFRETGIDHTNRRFWRTGSTYDWTISDGAFVENYDNPLEKPPYRYYYISIDDTHARMIDDSGFIFSEQRRAKVELDPVPPGFTEVEPWSE